MLNVPRDTCWQRRQDQPAHTAQDGPRGMANALGEIAGVPVSYAISVDFAGFDRPRRRDGRRADQHPVRDERQDTRARSSAPASSASTAGKRSRSRATGTTSRDSDITRTGNQGLVIIAGLRTAAGGGERAPWASSRRWRPLAATHGSTAWASRTSYRLARIAQRIDPADRSQRDDPGRRRQRLPRHRRRCRRPLRRLRRRRHPPNPLTERALRSHLHGEALCRLLTPSVRWQGDCDGRSGDAGCAGGGAGARRAARLLAKCSRRARRSSASSRSRCIRT